MESFILKEKEGKDRAPKNGKTEKKENYRQRFGGTKKKKYIYIYMGALVFRVWDFFDMQHQLLMEIPLGIRHEVFFSCVFPP